MSIKLSHILALVMLLAASAAAQTWTGAGANSNWSTPLNWTPTGAPVNNGTANLTFAGNTQLINNVDVPYSINSLTFNSSAGSFTINGSAITLGAGGLANNAIGIQTFNAVLQAGAPTVTLSAASGSLAIGPLSPNGNTMIVNTAAASSILGNIFGAGNLTKEGANTLTIGGAGGNTLTGTVTVNAGTLVLNKGASVDAFAGALVIGDGVGTDTVQLNNDFQTDNAPVTVKSSGIFNLNGFDEAVTTLTVDGGSVNVGTSIFTMTSGLTMTAGSIASTPGGAIILQASATTNAASAAATIAGWLDFNSATRTFTVADGTAADDLDISAYLPTGGITKNGPGTLRISGAQTNDMINTLTVNSGTLLLAKTGGARATSGNLSIGDGAGGANADVVRFLGHQQLAATSSITINSSGQLDLNNFNQDTSQLFMAGGSVITGTGTLSLSLVGITANTASSIASISGRLDLDNGSRTFFVADSPTLATEMEISAAISSPTVAGGALVKTGLGVLRLSGPANTYSGATTVNAGALALAKSAPDTAILGNLIIGDNDQLDTVRLDASNQIANSSNITFNRGGRLDLNGNIETVNTLTFSQGSGEVIGAGTLTIGGNVTSAAGTSANDIFPALNLGGGNRIFTIAEGAAVPDLLIAGNISNGTLEKQGPGELQLNGNNTARISLGAGRLTLVNNNNLGTLPAFFGDGAISALFNLTIATPFFLVGTNTTFDGAQSLTFTDIFSGIGGLTKTGPGTLSFTAPNTIQGTWILDDGTLNATALEIGTPGRLTMDGGTFTGTLDNRGTVTFNNGSFDGTLINNGTLVINNVVGMNLGGLINNTNIILAAGQRLAVGGAGLQNNGSITLNNSMLDLFASANNGIISGFGVIDGNGGFTNNGLISQDGGNIILSNSTSQRNNGNIDLAPGRQLILQSTPLDNRGTINLNGGLISGSVALQNNLGGTISGRGSILNSFANNAGATLLPQGGTINIPNAFSNSGTISIGGAGAALVGGLITNAGTIQGAGSIANNITSAGTIEAIGGTLTLGGAVTNTGTMAASMANKLLFSSGLAANAGLINLTGGTFDNNSFNLTNNGQISGFGVLRAAILTNNGSMTFTGGQSTINGDVINSPGKQIRVAYNPALFTGTVTNNGIFKNTATTVTFSGTYIENGTFISDPADNFFNSVNIGRQGAWVGGIGDRFFVSGDFLSQSTSAAWDTKNAELHLLLGGELLGVNGRDLGVSFDGYENNFAWGRLSLAAGRTLTLVDADSSPGGAIYVGYLDLQGGIDQISAITGNGMTLYYHLGNPNNTYLAGRSYELAGGGSITPVPEPSSVLGTLLLAVLVLSPRRQSRSGIDRFWRRK